MIRSTLPIAAFFLAGALAPALVHAIGGQCWVFLPAHFPALLGGLWLGPLAGLAAGFGTLASDLCLGGGPSGWKLLQIGSEICVYGVSAGYFGKRLPPPLALLAAMLTGRLVYSGFALVEGEELTRLVTSLVLTPLPGIAAQLLLLPLLVWGLRRASPQT